MNRPSKKDIKAAIEGLKNASGGSTNEPSAEHQVGAPSGKKAPNRIRKKGV